MNLAGYQSKNQSEPGALQLRHSLILQQPESDENPRFPTDALPEYGDTPSDLYCRMKNKLFIAINRKPETHPLPKSKTCQLPSWHFQPGNAAAQVNLEWHHHFPYHPAACRPTG